MRKIIIILVLLIGLLPNINSERFSFCQMNIALAIDAPAHELPNVECEADTVECDSCHTIYVVYDEDDRCPNERYCEVCEVYYHSIHTCPTSEEEEGEGMVSATTMGAATIVETMKLKIQILHPTQDLNLTKIRIE